MEDGVSTRARSVLVSGATRGIGLATALMLAEHGFRVWAGYRRDADAGAIASAAAARGVEVRPAQMEVTDPQSVRDVVAQIAADAPLYGVVNNAAVTLRGYFEDLSEQEIRHTLEVNLFGMMNVTRAALPLLRQAGTGRLIMMSSVGGRIGSMGLTAYVASKFGLEGFSECLKLELAPTGIDVVIIEPGIVKTAMWGEGRRIAAAARDVRGFYHEWFTRAEEQADNLVRSSRLTPDDVARVVLTAMTTKRPRLRYTVGRRASMVMSLRRYLPGEMFERFYFGEVIKRVTGHRDA